MLELYFFLTIMASKEPAYVHNFGNFFFPNTLLAKFFSKTEKLKTVLTE